MHKNTYTRLKDGTWGVASNNPAMVKGKKACVTVVKKNGDTKAHDVACFWHGQSRAGGHLALCRIEDVHE